MNCLKPFVLMCLGFGKYLIHTPIMYSICYSYAASVDDILEEEEHYADQLKEYLFYADALRYCIRVA